MKLAISNQRIVYLCGGRSFHLVKPGRKISSVVECWRRLGHEILHVCGGDVVNGSADGSFSEYGAVSFHHQWYRRAGILNPLIRTISERRDIQHDAAMMRHLERVCESFQPDLIWERSCRLHHAGLSFARQLGVAYVLEWKDHLVDYRLSLFRRKALQTENRKNREADFVVVESEVLRDKLSKEGVERGKIIVAHNAVKVEEFRRDELTRARVRSDLGVDESTILVGYLGSYAFYHDTACMVRAADLLRASPGQRKIRILMVGGGKEYAGTRKVAHDLALLDEILIMKPGVPKEQVPGILSALDIAVLPGSTDIICPIKVQEYMASELASVVPDYACNREVIEHGRTGMLFTPRSEQALAENIRMLAEDNQVRLFIGREAQREVSRRFTWEKTWGAALEEVLRRVEGEKRPAHESLLPVDGNVAVREVVLR